MVKKRILSIALALCLVLTALPLSGVLALAAAGGDFQYEVLSEADKTCEITGYTGTATELEIPSTLDGYTVTSIGEYAFYSCSSLTSIDIPNSVTSIGMYAFVYCSSLVSIDIPDSVTSIGDGAFAYCSLLTNFNIPDGVTSIGASAFEGCTSLTSIDIPNSVTSIGAGAFADCPSLTSINVAAENPNYSSLEGVLFNKAKTELLAYPAEKTDTTYNIPGTVTSIGASAFEDCTSLTSIEIPDGVTSIGDSAFHDCTLLTSIAIPNSVTSIGDSAFYRCTSLTSIHIPDGVTSIGEFAFTYCSLLTSINIPNSVTSIGEYAFEDCTSLTSIEIPDGVTSIGEYAFVSCTSLASINIPDSVTSIGEYAFVSCTSLTSIDVAADNPNYTSQEGVLFNKGKTELLMYPAKKIDTAYSIPETVTSIGALAFAVCTSLASIDIPDSVTSIGDGVFFSCTLLASIDIPDSVTSIGTSAFAYCTSLTSVTIGNGVTSIGVWAFEACTSLTSVFIPESVMYIEESAFLDCENVTIYGAAGSYAETYAEQNDIRFVGVSPTLAKDRSQVRFTAENGDIADAFDYRLISSIPDMVWDLYFASAGGTTITAVGFVAANESDRATLADAQAAVESDTALPAGWKTADTDYTQKTGDDADAYFGCMIKGIKHSEQTEDIVCSAYIAYTTAAGQTAYVWYDAPIVAPVATNYDAAADAWREMNA